MKICFKIESAEIRKVGDSKIYSVTLRGIDEERKRSRGLLIFALWDRNLQLSYSSF